MDCADAREQPFEEDEMTLASIEVEAGVEDTFVNRERRDWSR
jgi:hypothetical protein